MNTFLKSAKTRLRVIGFIEGISYLVLLLIAMPLKYLADIPEVVRYVGMAHGILFVWFVLLILRMRFAGRMSNKDTAVSLVSSVVPAGTFYADKQIFKKI